MDNIDLKHLYDKIYSNDSKKYFTENNIQESVLIHQMGGVWNNLKVLEVGCGEGSLAAMLGFSGAFVDAVDYSEEAIRIARKRINVDNVSFYCADYRDIKGNYDAIVMQGVLEHFDKPFDELKGMIDKHLIEGGFVITSSPSFLNPRGFVWMALLLLLEVPMSRSDIHYLCPFDFDEFAQSNDYKLEYKSTAHDWAAGELTIIDFKKRLTNALQDAKLNNANVDVFLKWLSKAVVYYQPENHSGATVAYKITKIS